MTLTSEQMLARALGRRAFLRGGLMLSAAGAAAYAIGCGSGDDDGAEATATLAMGTPAANTPGAGGTIRPSLLTSEFVVNENNRFLVGLVGPDGQLVENAKVELRFYKVGADGVTGTFRRGGEATFLKLSIEGAHAHDNTGGELAEVEEVSFYGVTAPFDEAGKWGVEIIATPSDGSDPTTVQLPFEVLAAFETPPNGEPAPASQNDTVETTADIETLCSRDPQCDLHDLVIADAVGKGRPVVVQFSTPAFCETQICGPTLETVKTVATDYPELTFINVEPFLYWARK